MFQFIPFDQQKIDRLRLHLESSAAKGHSRFYEIYVDNLIAVPKTDDPSAFEGYEDDMNADTSQIKIKIYSSGTSPRNEQWTFLMKARNNKEAFDQGLDGLSFQSMSKNDLLKLKAARDRKNLEAQEIEELKEEIEELNGELEEKTSYINRLETGIETAKANSNKIGDVHIGEIVSVALEVLVRRNTGWIAQVPALSGLADYIDKDTERKKGQPGPSAPEPEVTFKRKEAESEPVLTEQEQYFLKLFAVLRQNFIPSELEQVIELLENLSKDKSKIQPALALFQS